MKNATLKTLTKPSSITDLNTTGEALENKGAATEEKYRVFGVITEIKNTQYGNFYIKDAEGKTQLAHTLTGSSLALPRVVAALLENNQKGDRIEIPEALRPYTGFDYID